MNAWLSWLLIVTLGVTVVWLAVKADGRIDEFAGERARARAMRALERIHERGRS